MSYRSIKTVFGETKLELKLLTMLGTGLFLVIAAGFWYSYGRIVHSITVENRKNGRSLVEQEMQVQHWKGLENERSQQFVRSLAAAFSKQQYRLKFILPKPPATNSGDKEDYAPQGKFEEDVLKRFLESKPGTGADPVEFAERSSPDGNTYYYYQAIRATESTCFACHQPASKVTGETSLQNSSLVRSVAETQGDLMAVARLAIPTEQMQKTINLNRAILIATAIITVFLTVVACYAIIRYVIVKPLRHLRDTSDAISRGNTALRAEIHTGDEFEQLAVAFNRMLRHLTDAQEELRNANVTLDGKVDELAQANMRLYELNMLKSDFLATMSHELRTPLNSILGFSEVLATIDALDEKQKRYVQNIQRSGKTLLEMINDILDLAKIESGKMETRLSDCHVSHVVAAQCEMARPLSERKNIDLECHIENDLPPMHQDQARVQQILNNLLSNAIKFTPEGGRIVVAANRDAADFLVLSVTDTGVGIAPEDQSIIFEKFRQGRTAMPDGDAMTREHSGSGLGLSIVKELCRLLGGEVSLQSELGKGSTFTVRLPWALEDEPRVDGAIAVGLEDFARQRFEPARAHEHAAT
ncbi:MAG: HAMP domain-containing protein [Planctomycetaceae bacterium]|nr:HAMP domain-containing protein [Planctomycetaceae bacterium]